MEKKLLTIVVLLVVNSVFAQNKNLYVGPPLNIGASENNIRASDCSDSLMYSYVKEIYYPTADTFYTEIFKGAGTGWSQGFELNGSILVNGILFWGNVASADPGKTITVKAYLYTTNASNKPLSKIDSATVVIGTAQKLYTAFFSSPVTVNTDYAVAIQNPTNDTLEMVLNNASASTHGEGLAWRRITNGTWSSAAGYFGQDVEPIISPIVEYNINTNFTVTPQTTVCQGTGLTFTNTTPGLIQHRMYNFNVFAEYWRGIPDSTYSWDMGNGSPVIWSKNAAYNYPVAGNYNSVLLAVTGFFKTCFETKLVPVTIQSLTTASFTFSSAASPNIAFTNNSSEGNSFSWDFGDGSPLNGTPNPSHTYTPGTYTVTLTSTNTCNTDTYSAQVVVVATGIAANQQMKGFTIAQNPSSGIFNIGANINTQYTVEVYNLIGEKIYSRAFNSPDAVIDLTGYSQGIYSMQVYSGNQIVGHSKIVIRD